MNEIDGVLLRWHQRLRALPLLYRLAVGTRVLLAVGFIPTGLVKVLGRRFAYMNPEYPIGAFFETLYQSGPYWHFIGAAQVVAGLLVLAPRTATLGAALFLPIMANIFVITISYDFNLTPVLTGLMLLAVLYLLAWDYHRIRPLLGVPLEGHVRNAELPRHQLGRAEHTVYVIGAVAGLAFFGGTRFAVLSGSLQWWWFRIAAVAALSAVIVGWRSRARARVGLAQERGTGIN